MDKPVEYLEKVISPFFQKTRNKHRYPKEQMSLVFMDAFEGQDNKVLKDLCVKSFCDVVIVPHNLKGHSTSETIFGN